MKYIIVDFDETLISRNSFPLWVIYLLKKSLVTLNFNSLLFLISLLIKRKIIGSITHLEFKRKIDNDTFSSYWGKEFVKSLLIYRVMSVEKTIKLEMDKHKENILIFSTAAPECYAKHIKSFFLTEYDSICLHSHSLNQKKEYFDNFQEGKLKSLIDINLETKPWVLFSDHFDDLPIAQKSEKFYLCNPTQKTQTYFDNEGIIYKLIKESNV